MILSLPSAVIEKVSGPLSLIRGSDVIVDTHPVNVNSPLKLLYHKYDTVTFDI
jgi:hypothetical protein